MYTRTKMFIITILVCLIIQSVKSEVVADIPNILKECYSSEYNKVGSAPPLTIPVLVELIRKIERDERNAINMKMLSTSMLRAVIFDGVRSANTNYGTSAIPYRATGNEFYKYKLVQDYLIQGKATQFPKDSFSSEEFCYLHKMLSKTVEPKQRGDEDRTCVNKKSIPIDYINTGTQSTCPQKFGLVSSKWGTVTAELLLNGLASNLQETTVQFERIEAIEEEHTTVNKTPNVDPKKRFKNTNSASSLWISTIAGDLAEVLLNQATNNPVIGNDGFWNDTIYPSAYYISDSKWDMIEADVIGGIDGILLGLHINEWKDVPGIKIHQLIDMYYSSRGIAMDNNIKASNRFDNFQKIFDQTFLANEVEGTAQLLQGLGTPYPVQLSESEIKSLSLTVTKIFKEKADQITKKYDMVESIYDKSMMSVVEIIVILDGTYDYETTKRMLYSLSEVSQVSYYGSKIGIINGQSGNWMVNVTGQLFKLSTDLYQTRNEWPAILALGNSLDTVNAYYQNKTNNSCSEIYNRPVGQVIIVVSKDGRLTDNDRTKTERALRTLKGSFPETKMIYLTSNEDSVFKQLMDDESDVVINPQNSNITTGLPTLVNTIFDKISKVPGSIINFHCKNTSQVRFEDYITPGIERSYEIHREYLLRGDIIVKFNNHHYGDISICAMSSRSAPSSRVCEKLTVDSDISFNTKLFCAPNSACGIIFYVSTNNTELKCAERDCRYPDQVRLTILYDISSSSKVIIFNVLLISTLAFLVNF